MKDFAEVERAAQENEQRPSAGKLEREGLELFLRHTPFLSAQKLMELGVGSGRVAEIVLGTKCSAETTYLGLDFRSETPPTVQHTLRKFNGRARCQNISPALVFPVESASRDLLYSCYQLEHLRMDQLYMAFSEARRILMPGGIWSILAEGPETKWWRRAWRAVTFSTSPSIELTHYISPEDWAIEQDHRSSVNSRLLVLRKIG